MTDVVLYGPAGGSGLLLRLGFGCTRRLAAWRNVLAIGLIALVWLSGCQKRQKPPEGAEQPTGESPEREIDRLRSLGYVSTSEESSGPKGGGLVKLDKQRWCPGFTLYNSRNDCVADLLDLEGHVLHAWQQSDGRTWDDCVLLPDGDLLVVGSDLVTDRESPVVDEARFLMQLSWDSRILWKRKIFAHHDVHLTPDDRIIVITHKYARIPGLEKNRVSRIDYLTMMSREGEFLEEKSLYEALTSNVDEFQFRAVGAVTTGSEKRWDPFHTNSVEWMHWEHLLDRHPIYAAGNVLVCVRHQDAIAIINWKRNQLLWAWGPGEIQGPHDAQVLKNGNILLFDNGLWRKWSRVIELDPLTKRIVWEYRAPNPADFYTRSGGGCQRLSNENTLITDSDNGHAFEVTKEGDIVWEFFNPKVTLKGKRLSCAPMRRYTPGYVESILEQHR